MVATGLGLVPDDDRVPDLSPQGQEAKDDLARRVLSDLDAIEAAAGPDGLDAADAGARACCASGWAPAWPLPRRASTCAPSATSSARRRRCGSCSR